MRICIARGCGKEVTTSFFQFCREHWAMVPLYMKDEITAAYSRRQGEPEVFSAILEGAKRLILEWENQDDGA